MPTAGVYVNWGRLVADCWCGDAREVEIGMTTMTCCVGHGCPGHVSELEWPHNMAAILAALDERLSSKRKNWFPSGHPLALAGNYPHGQTPDDLRAETDVGEEHDARMVAQQRDALVAQLRALGSTDDIIRALQKDL
jgi:hypothetical protein